MEKIKRIVPELLCFGVVAFFFLYRVLLGSSFNPDLGRDLMWIWDIIHGTTTLLGPKLSFGGYYLGPHYYYFFAPFVYLSHGFPTGLIIGNALVSALFMSLIFSILRRRHGFLYSSLAVLWLSITPYVLFSARNPGNAYSYISALLLHLILMVYSNKTRAFYFGAGLFAGCILNFHPAAVFAMIPFYFGTLPRTGWKEFFVRSVLFGFGLGIMFSPTILFEVRHHFIMFTNTFIDKSYQSFIGGQSAASMMKASLNPFLNAVIVDRFLSPWIAPTLLWLSGIICIAMFTKRTEFVVRVCGCLAGLLALFHVALQFQVAFHYAFPLLVGLQVGVIALLSQLSARIRYGILALCILAAVWMFPRQYFMRPYREFSPLYQTTHAAVQQLPRSADSVSVAYFGGNPLATLGYEYRYFLKIEGYAVAGEQEYAQSKNLIVVSEEGELDFTTLRTWELDQFGKKQLVKKVRVGSTIFYLFRKTE